METYIKPLLPEDGLCKLSQGYHSALRGKSQDSNPYKPGGPKFTVLDGSDLLWDYGYALGKADKK